MRTPPFIMSATVSRPGRSADVTLPCYWWNHSAWQNRQAVAALADVDSDHMLVAHGSDIQEGDRVLSVTDHLGRTVFSEDDFRVVDLISFERNHLDCTLRCGRVGGARQ